MDALQQARSAAAKAFELNAAESLATIVIAWIRGAFDYDLLVIDMRACQAAPP